MFYLCVCLLVGVAFAQDDPILGPIVDTTEGQVQGALATDGDYYVFYGLYYGGPTSGANRFKPPTPPPQYPGVFHAIDNTTVCVHATSTGVIGVEDCLVLNIHTKNLTTPKPVMVILLGDEYASIDLTVYSYRRLVEADFVVVTMNYRLSIFGFLCLGVPEAQGNAGLKDVMQGLRWIQDNIAGFGGDPNNVILFGHGSGAAMVDLITLSPLSTDLVHKAITKSGSALAPWAVAYEPVQYARVFAAKLGYTQTSPQEISENLMSTNLTSLTTALLSFEFLNNSVLFAPCLENPELNDTILTEAPINIIRSGNYNHIPILTGYTNQEGTIRARQAMQDGWLNRMQQNFADFIQVDLAFDSVENKTSVANAIKTFYFGANSVTMSTIRNYLQYHGDTTIIISVIRGARERALTSRESIRLMEFGYKGTMHSDWIYPQIPNEGARHGSVLNYLFDYDLKAYDEGARAALIKRYTLFADTGNPTAGPEHVIWNPITSSILHYLEISGNSDTLFIIYGESAESNPRSEENTFWNSLYDNYYQAPTLPTPPTPPTTTPSPPTSAADKLLNVAFILVLTQIFTKLL